MRSHFINMCCNRRRSGVGILSVSMLIQLIHQITFSITGGIFHITVYTNVITDISFVESIGTIQDGRITDCYKIKSNKTKCRCSSELHVATKIIDLKLVLS